MTIPAECFCNFNGDTDGHPWGGYQLAASNCSLPSLARAFLKWGTISIRAGHCWFHPESVTVIQRRTAIQPNSTLGFVILLLKNLFVDEHADINLIYTVYILYTCIVLHSCIMRKPVYVCICS